MSMRQALVSGIGTADAAMADAPLRNKRGTLCPRVLVVEDDAWLAIELERLLDELGCEVCTIVNYAHHHSRVTMPSKTASADTSGRL
jgi:hypothetical protein